MATTIKYRFRVDEITDALTIYDVVKIYRSTVDYPYTWVELTGVPTRITLVASVTEYLYDDATGDPDYWYCYATYNSSTTEESEKSNPVQPPPSGYVTVDDMRDEGYAVADVTDAQIRRGAAIATTIIDKITNQWFEPRAHTFLLDGRGKSKTFLDVPIIAITAIEVDESEIDFDFDTMKIYNRHLTQRLLNPDDRFNPMLVYDESYWQNIFGVSKKTEYLAGSFYAGVQNIKLTGYFGFTELASGAPVGETATNSQVPLSYGETPELIKYAARRLCVRHMYPLAKQAKGYGTDLAMMGNVTERKNRDQLIKFGGSTSVSSLSSTGDPVVDEILAAHAGPLRAEVV